MFSKKTNDAADGAVDSWLERLDAASAASPPLHRTQIRYALIQREVYYVPRIELEAYAASMQRDGSLSDVRAVDILAVGRLAGSYATAADRTIARLAVVSGVVRQALSAPAPAIVSTLLELALETHRLHWQTLSNPPLRRANVIDRLAWRSDSDGRQRPTLQRRSRAVLLPAKPPWYVDPETFEAGVVELGISPDVAAVVAASPALTQRQAERVQIGWRRAIPNEAAESPASDLAVEFVRDEPVPLLHIGSSESFFADLRFAYGSSIVAPSDAQEAFESKGEATTKIRVRRRDSEAAAWNRLLDLGFHADSDGRLSLDSAAAWAGFMHVKVPRLRSDGWRIVADGGAHITVVEPDADWDVRLAENEHRWFDLDLGITIAGERVALLPILVRALQENGSSEISNANLDPFFAQLPSGAYAALPGQRVARLVAALIELFETEPLTREGRLALSPAHVGALGELVHDGTIGWYGSSHLQRLVERLREPGKVQLPPTFHGELRSYQETGVAWLQALRDSAFGAVLADDMGLGKTVQLLAHAATERARGRLTGPILIVAPTSVIPNWRAEIARFTPDFRVLSLTGPERARAYDRIAESDIVLTTYALLRRDAERLLEQRWSLAVLDEAQSVKNPLSKGARYVRKLRADQHIALTGTPIENHLDELWSIFAFAVPPLLGERAAFARRFRTPIEKHGDSQRRRALAARLHPFLMRRTKESVEADLPAKSEIVQLVELAGAQRDLYETIRLAMHQRVREELHRRLTGQSRIIVLDALLKLRQVCCDPRLVKLPAAASVTESAKLEALLDMLPDLLADGRRILLFSQFTSMLDLIKPELRRRDMAFVELRGSTRDRETPVARFQSGEVPLFLISLKAGGTGLNLTAADTVIHYDPWWNPAVERQATDRAHRIGQEHPVFAYRLVTVGTVEQRVLEMQARKAALADDLFGEAHSTATLDPADIERLFAP